ncbi:MAG TPA: hypothetical protein VGF12_21030 [Roseateles sp.]|uniref:hypothetical protein n=1 Tax=Roseateles sp. TaxID=1971397 RepID=UPI002EDB9769
MLTPPFKRSAGRAAVMDAAATRGQQAAAIRCCEHEPAAPERGATAQPRAKLHQLDPHLLYALDAGFLAPRADLVRQRTL